MGFFKKTYKKPYKKRAAKTLVVKTAKRRTTSVMKSPPVAHRFIRWVDGQDMWISQANTLSGAYGLYGTAGGIGGVPTIGYSQGFFYAQAVATSCAFVSLNFLGVLQSLPSYTEFTSLFDTYKINGYTVEISNVYNTFSDEVIVAGGGIYNDPAMPYIHSAIDYDSSNNVTANAAGVNQLRQYKSYKVKRLGSKDSFWKRTVTHPGVLQTTNTGTVGTPSTALATVKRSPELDCAQAQVPHSGLLVVLELFNPSAQAAYFNFKIEVKYNFTLISPR